MTPPPVQSSVEVPQGDLRLIRANDRACSLICTPITTSAVVAIVDTRAQIATALHFVLPCLRDPDQDPMVMDNPFLCGDTGIPLLFERAYKAGVLKKDMTTLLVGGANLKSRGKTLSIGRQNLRFAHLILQKAKVPFEVFECGGKDFRTLEIQLPSGEISVHRSDRIEPIPFA